MSLNEVIDSLRTPAYRCAGAAEKQDAMWAAIEATRYDQLPEIQWNLITSSLRGSLPQILAKPFDVLDDVRPPRRKIFHPFGTVAKMEWEPAEGSPFTGLLAERAVGIVRLSIAMTPRYYVTGAALKFFVDGSPSHNLVVNPSLDPQETRDFFELTASNIIPAPVKYPLGTFWAASEILMSLVSSPDHQPVGHLAEVTSAGNAVEEPHRPYQLFLRAPTWPAAGRDQPNVHQDPFTNEDFRVLLGELPPETVIYFVQGVTSGGAELQRIGQVRIKTRFVASELGDRGLSFRHTRLPVITTPVGRAEQWSECT